MSRPLRPDRRSWSPTSRTRRRSAPAARGWCRRTAPRARRPRSTLPGIRRARAPRHNPRSGRCRTWPGRRSTPSRPRRPTRARAADARRARPRPSVRTFEIGQTSRTVPRSASSRTRPGSSIARIPCRSRSACSTSSAPRMDSGPGDLARVRNRAEAARPGDVESAGVRLGRVLSFAAAEPEPGDPAVWRT